MGRPSGRDAAGLGLLTIALIIIPAGLLYYSPPPSAVAKEINLRAEQWAFLPSGDITVEQGDLVKLRVLSSDVVHGVKVDGYEVDAIAYPGVPASLEFRADKPGLYTILCSVECGEGHHKMVKRLKVNRAKPLLSLEEVRAPAPSEIHTPGATSPSPGAEAAPEQSPALRTFRLVADQWAFNETNPTLTVHEGDRVKLVVTSRLSRENGGEYEGHGLIISGYVSVDLPVGETIEAEFTADRAGVFNYFCSVACGKGHNEMRGKLIVE